MTKLAARTLLLVLVAKGIPYRLRRENNLYLIVYDTKWRHEVGQATGGIV